MGRGEKTMTDNDALQISTPSIVPLLGLLGCFRFWECRSLGGRENLAAKDAKIVRGMSRMVYNGSMTETSTSTEPALWNPKKAAVYGFFVPPVGMLLHALNWRRLYVKQRERANLIWLFGYVIVMAGLMLLNIFDNAEHYHPRIPIVMASIVYSLLWGRFEAIRQIEYLREEKHLFTRNLFAPFGLGVIVVIGFTVIVGLFGCLKGGPKIYLQIWTDVYVSRNDDFGSIRAFNLLPGSNTVIEVSHTSGVTPENSTRHASFDTLLIALPDKSCLTVGAKYELDSTDNHVQYSAFTGRYAVCIDTNATAKAIVTVLSATKKAVNLRIECLIPCLWYHPLHDMDGETVTYEKTVHVTARFSIVDTHKKNNAKTPIVTYIAQEPDTND